MCELEKAFALSLPKLLRGMGMYEAQLHRALANGESRQVALRPLSSRALLSASRFYRRSIRIVTQ